uniref:Uncharacterized protein n=1 Tax=Anguilla anguilla TaxID=7936 RepID=A0A0E9PWM1_ANGAN
MFLLCPRTVQSVCVNMHRSLLKLEIGERTLQSVMSLGCKIWSCSIDNEWGSDFMRL